MNKFLWILKYSFIRRARSCKRYLVFLLSFILSLILVIVWCVNMFSIFLLCSVLDMVTMPTYIARIFFNMCLGDCLLLLFCLSFKICNGWQRFFYENKKLICIFKSDFFCIKTNLYFSDMILLTQKLIYIFIKYKSDFFRKSFLCYKIAEFEI